MTKERRGQIALAMIKREMTKNGIPLSSNSERNLGNLAKELGKVQEDLVLKGDELQEFIAIASKELLDKCYGKFFQPGGYEV